MLNGSVNEALKNVKKTSTGEMFLYTSWVQSSFLECLAANTFSRIRLCFGRKQLAFGMASFVAVCFFTPINLSRHKTIYTLVAKMCKTRKQIIFCRSCWGLFLAIGTLHPRVPLQDRFWLILKTITVAGSKHQGVRWAHCRRPQRSCFFWSGGQQNGTKNQVAMGMRMRWAMTFEK